MALYKQSSPAQLLRRQFVAGVLGFLALAAAGQLAWAVSLLGGVLLMAGNGYWLARRLEQTDGLDVEESQRSLYVGAAARFAALLAALLVAQLVGLHLLLVAAGMFFAQAVVFVSALIGFGKERYRERHGGTD